MSTGLKMLGAQKHRALFTLSTRGDNLVRFLNSPYAFQKSTRLPLILEQHEVSHVLNYVLKVKS